MKLVGAKWLAGLVSLTLFGASGSWTIQYFYDRNDSRFIINDFAFVTSTRGYAAGYRQLKSSREPKPYLIATSDGGKSWREFYPPSVPQTIYFLTEDTGWMATSSGIWQTIDGGISWANLATLAGVNRLYFLDEKRGFAVGYPKLMKQTRDGGTIWTEVAGVKDIKANPDTTTFTSIVFSGRHGVVAGVRESSRPDAQQPAWVDPEEAASRRLWPTLSISISTSDGGETWNAQTAPVFGVTTKMRLNGKIGMTVVRYAESFEYPSEVYGINGAGTIQSLYKQKNRLVTDVGWLGSQTLLVSVDPPGKMNQLPFPGKIRVLQSLDLRDWTEMSVSYKAFGGNAMFSILDENKAWIATDAGMILHYEPQAPR